MKKILVGALLTIAILVAVDKLLLADMEIGVISKQPIGKIIKLFEAAILFVLVSGFVLQEIVHKIPQLTDKAESKQHGAEWSDLLKLFGALFVSGFLYIALARLGGWT